MTVICEKSLFRVYLIVPYVFAIPLLVKGRINLAKVTRSIQYRYLNREMADFSNDTLQSIIGKAFKKTRLGGKIGKLAKARIADLAGEGQSTLLNAVSDTVDDQTVFTGQLILYKKGFDVPTLQEEADSDKNQFDITQYKTDGKSKPIEGILYFAVIDDHVGLIASNAVTGRWLERYLTWLLNSATDLIDTDECVLLNADINIDDEDRSDISSARSVTIATSSGVNDQPDSFSKNLKRKDKAKGNNIFRILKILGLGEDAISSLASAVPEGDSLEGDFSIYVKHKRNKKPFAKATIDQAFRNVPVDDLSLASKEGRIKGNLLRLSYPARVEAMSSSLLDPNDAIDQIIDQMRKWVKDGHINLDRDK